jgi:hypothetical protein
MNKITTFILISFLLVIPINAFAKNDIYKCRVQNVYSFDMEHRSPMDYEGSKFTVNKSNGSIVGDKFGNENQKILNISIGGHVYPFEVSSVGNSGSPMEYLCINEYEDNKRKSFIYKNVFWFFTGYCE